MSEQRLRNVGYHNDRLVKYIESRPTDPADIDAYIAAATALSDAMFGMANIIPITTSRGDEVLHALNNLHEASKPLEPKQ